LETFAVKRLSGSHSWDTDRGQTIALGWTRRYLPRTLIWH